MATCLVLGGNGFIGSHIVDKLIEADYRVKVFSTFKSGTFNLRGVLDKVELIKGDFLNAKDIENAINGVDYIFHNIAFTIPQTSITDPIYDAKNVTSSIKLLQVAVNKGVKKIIFSSSGGTVYGDPLSILVPETHPTNPISPYGVSKLSIEKYIQIFNCLYGLDYTILRYSNAYGERQNPFGKVGAITIFLEKVRRGEPLVVFGDGNIIKDYVYVKDIADANLLALEKPSKEKIFNVGSGIGTSLNRLIKLISEITAQEVKVEYNERKKGDVSNIVLDTSRIRRELGWVPKTSLEEGIRNVWDWLKT